jgi:hypothetical protein
VLSFSDSEFLFEAQKASVEDLRLELLREGKLKFYADSVIEIFRLTPPLPTCDTVNSYLPKPVQVQVQVPRPKGSFIVIDEESKDLGPTATFTAAALLLVQEKEKPTAGDIEPAGVGAAYTATKDKQPSTQSQLPSHTLTEGGISRANSLSSVNNPTAAAHAASTAMLMAAPSDAHVTKLSNGKLDEQIRGNKRGRLDTPAAPVVTLKEKSAAVSSSSSTLAEDVSVVSEKMKALSTAANAVAPDRTNALVSTVIPSNTDGNPADAIPLYVRRGAKRTSLAAERPVSVAAASDPVAALSGLDDVPDEDGNEESEWGTDNKRTASLLAMSETAAERVTTCTKVVSITKSTGNCKQKGESSAYRTGNSLSSCLGRENDSDNADEGDVAVDDRDEADAGICNFSKSGYRNSRRCRAMKRTLLSTSITTQKPDPCLIL